MILIGAMRSILRFAFTFLAVTGAVVISTNVLGIQFEHLNFWDYHGVLFLVFITFFPRLTLLLSGVPTGGILWWLSWVFAPRLLVAFLATITYWYQNPFLVVFAWLAAIGGESSEKYAVMHKSKSYRSSKGYDSAKWVDSE
jgi:hypothetical protein